MERIKNMSLKKSFFWLTFWCLLGAVLLSLLSFAGCIMLRRQLSGSEAQIIIQNEAGSPAEVLVPPPDSGTAVTPALSGLLEFLQIGLPIFFLLAALILSDILFYRLKLKAPIAALQQGAQHIMEGNLDFTVSLEEDRYHSDSADELTQLCSAFEAMRIQLKLNNQELWRQAEERKRLNAAFSHDLRNPITVIKGTVRLLQQGGRDQSSIDRLETYTSRLEQYVEAMSSIHRLEELPVHRKEITLLSLRRELEETAAMLAPGLAVLLPLEPDQEDAALLLDPNLFFNVAENLIGNASRFARHAVILSLTVSDGSLTLAIGDDGPGFPPQLLKEGPRPFQKGTEDISHFGMGLYICKMLCEKHGGSLMLENQSCGARVTARF